MKAQIILAVLFAVASNATAQDPKRTERLKLLKTFHSEFVAINPGNGKFPKHEKLKQPFRIAKYEVPQNLWRSVMGSNPSRWRGERNSVERLSFGEAKAFCKKATLLMRNAKLISEREVIRLPYEDEWEYAAGAGTTTDYSFGDDVTKLNEYAWSTHNAAGNDPEVGVLKPNPWGLYDVHGYLWEWCLPRESSEARDNKGKAGNKSQASAVLRGGSWLDPAERLKTKFRSVVSPNSRDHSIGLRCVLVSR